jgi:hypothetical protein
VGQERLRNALEKQADLCDLCPRHEWKRQLPVLLVPLARRASVRHHHHDAWQHVASSRLKARASRAAARRHLLQRVLAIAYKQGCQRHEVRLRKSRWSITILNFCRATRSKRHEAPGVKIS